MTNPVALSTHIWGEGPKRALLLHGLSSAGAGWWRVAPELVDLGFTVVAPDLRAHGASPAGDDLTLDSYRDDVLLLGVGWDLVLGHSLGGAIAVAAMSEQPGFARTLILVDPAIDSTVTERLLAAAPEPSSNPTVAGLAAEHPNWHAKDIAAKVEALLQCGVDGPQRTMEDASPWDVWPETIALTVPTLILAADPKLGSLVSAVKGAEAIAANELIQFALLEDASHSMHRDAFDRFVAVTRAFLTE